MTGVLTEAYVAQILRDHIVRQPRSVAKRLILQCERKLAEIIASDNIADREQLAEVYAHMLDLVQMRLVLDAFKLVGETERSAGIASAKHARDAKYDANTQAKAVQAVKLLRAANHRISVNAACNKVGTTLGIPSRTLNRWVSGR